MTRACSGCKGRRPFPKRRFGRSGFSLVEVVIATGLCTYALVVIACLLPMGMGTVQTANAQIVETEIFNRIFLEVNSTPFYNLPTFFRGQNGIYADNSVNTTGLSYFDKDGGELGQNTATSIAAAKPSAIYFVYCTLVNSNVPATPATVLSSTISRLANTGPAVDGIGVTGGNSVSIQQLAAGNGKAAGSGLNLFKVAIGFHVDPTTVAATDTRVTTRSFVIAKRDTYNGN